MKICFGEIHAKLNEAMQIAMAAEACAKAGSLDQGVEISWTWTNCFMKQAACMMRSA